MGIKRPEWRDQHLDGSLEAFDYLVENHYRYYQFYSNTLVAILWAYPVHRAMNSSPLLGFGTDLGAIVLCAVLFAGSRDTLAKYYSRTSRLMGQVAEKDGDVMTNGNHTAEMSGGKKIPSINPANPVKEADARKPKQAAARPNSGR
ncbi:MAG TPA: hypothetical protein VHI52_02330 [Verrucomicrobiae bacterium]|nr:hypothetical protein [Verrucomicrobiae bacterium]